MSSPIDNAILRTLSKIAGALWRIFLFVIGWCFKLISKVVDKVADEILKNS